MTVLLSFPEVRSSCDSVHYNCFPSQNIKFHYFHESTEDWGLPAVKDFDQKLSEYL